MNLQNKSIVKRGTKTASMDDNERDLCIFKEDFKEKKKKNTQKLMCLLGSNLGYGVRVHFS